MRRIVFILALLVQFAAAMAQTASVSQFEGRWWLGILQEASLPLNFTFTDAKPVMYSPMQTSTPIPASDWSFAGDTLRISHKATGMRLVLVWNPADSSFRGSFRQGAMRTQMHFLPTDTLFSVVRPQTPKPPFPYTEKEVVIERKKAGVTLAGTLTLPDGAGPFPAVVLVSGSGQQNRDEELMGHKPFLVLADHLARNGIAVLRCDDRGTGGSKGDVANATTLDFADDAEAAFDFLRKQKKIDPKRVGIIGHSEGGMIAPIVASRNRKVAFAVLLAGPGTTGADILLQQNERILQLDSIPQPLIDRRLKVLSALYEAMDTLPPDRIQPYLIDLCDKNTKDLTADERKLAGLRRGDAIAMAIQMQLPWMRTFIKLDNSYYLRQVRCPILAINGELDSQVLPVVNLGHISEATESRATVMMFPGLNHLMQHCQTGSVNEYMLIEETMAPEVLDSIVDWLKKI